jgi:hypothetical protein
MKTVLVSILFLLFLSGCVTDPIIKQETVLIAPPKSLIVKCRVHTPPAIDEYIASDWSTKEKLLIDAYNKQMTTVQGCNIRIDALNEWIEKQKELYKDKP